MIIGREADNVVSSATALERTRLWKKEHRERIRDYARKHLLVVNGKTIVVNKRCRPDGLCELCGRKVDRLEYHHWDDNNPGYGVWVCNRCHWVCERIDEDILIPVKYIILKMDITNGLEG